MLKYYTMIMNLIPFSVFFSFGGFMFGYYLAGVFLAP